MFLSSESKNSLNCFGTSRMQDCEPGGSVNFQVIVRAHSLKENDEIVASPQASINEIVDSSSVPPLNLAFGRQNWVMLQNSLYPS